MPLRLRGLFEQPESSNQTPHIFNTALSPGFSFHVGFCVARSGEGRWERVSTTEFKTQERHSLGFQATPIASVQIRK